MLFVVLTLTSTLFDYFIFQRPRSNTVEDLNSSNNNNNRTEGDDDVTSRKANATVKSDVSSASENDSQVESADDASTSGEVSIKMKELEGDEKKKPIDDVTTTTSENTLKEKQKSKQVTASNLYAL